MATFIVVITVALLASSIVWTVLWGGQLPLPFRARPCQGKGWRQSFPEAPKHDIRRFLSIFVDAFAFDEREKLKLNPTDQLLDIYRALYPHRWQADALEFETFAASLKNAYGIELGQLWRKDLTLGQLFAHVQQSVKTRT